MTDRKLLPATRIGERTCTVQKQPLPDGATAYAFSNDNGNSQMTVYPLFPGVTLTHHAVHTDRACLGNIKKSHVIAIHHCREGRMECACGDGYFYLMPGDLAIEAASREAGEFVFPLRRYHGLTITIDTEQAPICFSCFLKDVRVQPTAVVRRLCRDRSCFVIRSKEYIEHLFSEMYAVPCENKKGYYKIKVLELLLVLSGVDPAENGLSTRTVSAQQVELAKKAAAYMAENHDAHLTVSMLSNRFHISATHLQNAFKGVFGVPVFAYMRLHKMNAAALQLVKTDKPIMEIANDCGYGNAGKFAAAFREIMNETPLEYRKSHRPPVPD